MFKYIGLAFLSVAAILMIPASSQAESVNSPFYGLLKVTVYDADGNEVGVVYYNYVRPDVITNTNPNTTIAPVNIFMRSMLSINIPGAHSLFVTDLKGKIVLQKNHTGAKRYDLSKSFIPGMYIITVKMASGIQSLKFLSH